CRRACPSARARKSPILWSPLHTVSADLAILHRRRGCRHRRHDRYRAVPGGGRRAVLLPLWLLRAAAALLPAEILRRATLLLRTLIQRLSRLWRWPSRHRYNPSSEFTLRRCPRCVSI